MKHPGINCRLVFYGLDHTFFEQPPTAQSNLPRPTHWNHKQEISTSASLFDGLKTCSTAANAFCRAPILSYHMIPGPTTNWTHKSRVAGMKALQPKGILSPFEPRAYLMTFTKSASKFQAFDSSHHPISAKRLCKGSGDSLPRWRTPTYFSNILWFFNMWIFMLGIKEPEIGYWVPIVFLSIINGFQVVIVSYTLVHAETWFPHLYAGRFGGTVLSKHWHHLDNLGREFVGIHPKDTIWLEVGHVPFRGNGIELLAIYEKPIWNFRGEQGRHALIPVVRQYGFHTEHRTYKLVSCQTAYIVFLGFQRRSTFISTGRPKLVWKYVHIRAVSGIQVVKDSVSKAFVSHVYNTERGFLTSGGKKVLLSNSKELAFLEVGISFESDFSTFILVASCCLDAPLFFSDG